MILIGTPFVPTVDRAGMPKSVTVGGKAGTAIAKITRRNGVFVLVDFVGIALPYEVPASEVVTP
jgi:hypothetical protein